MNNIRLYNLTPASSYKLENNMESKRFTLNKADLQAFGEETLKVVGPYLLVIIPVLMEQLPKEWVYASTTIFVLQRIRSLIVLFLSGKK